MIVRDRRGQNDNGRTRTMSKARLTKQERRDKEGLATAPCLYRTARNNVIRTFWMAHPIWIENSVEGNIQIHDECSKTYDLYSPNITGRADTGRNKTLHKSTFVFVESVWVLVQDSVAGVSGGRSRIGVSHTTKAVGGLARHGGGAKKTDNDSKEGEGLHCGWVWW